jgi:hypothetical protein
MKETIKVHFPADGGVIPATGHFPAYGLAPPGRPLTGVLKYGEQVAAVGATLLAGPDWLIQFETPLDAGKEYSFELWRSGGGVPLAVVNRLRLYAGESVLQAHAGSGPHGPRVPPLRIIPNGPVGGDTVPPTFPAHGIAVPGFPIHATISKAGFSQAGMPAAPPPNYTFWFQNVPLGPGYTLRVWSDNGDNDPEFPIAVAAPPA